MHSCHRRLWFMRTGGSLVGITPSCSSELSPTLYCVNPISILRHHTTWISLPTAAVTHVRLRSRLWYDPSLNNVSYVYQVPLLLLPCICCRGRQIVVVKHVEAQGLARHRACQPSLQIVHARAQGTCIHINRPSLRELAHNVHCTLCIV
jgi:hypothetical protein